MLFREMTITDVEYMKNHSVSRGIFSKMPRQTEFSFCLEHEGKVLGIGGIQLINLTTAWAWLDLSDSAGEHIIVVYRVIKEWLNELAKIHSIKRFQCYVEDNFPEAIRMVEHLSFHYEATMKNFVDDKCAYLYARFQE